MWVSESIFGPLIFFQFKIYQRGVRGNNNIGIKKCTTIFLREWSSTQVGVLPQEFSKSPSCGLQLVDPRGCFWGQISGIFFFFAPKKFLRDLPYKIEGEFDFWWKRTWIFLQVIYLEKTKFMGIPYVLSKNF